MVKVLVIKGNHCYWVPVGEQESLKSIYNNNQNDATNSKTLPTWWHVPLFIFLPRVAFDASPSFAMLFSVQNRANILQSKAPRPETII